MAEEVGHGPDVYACMDELGCREVTEVLETHVVCSHSVADTDEERRHVVRVERGRCLHAQREDEGVVGERPSSLGDLVLDPLPVGSEEGDADAVDQVLLNLAANAVKFTRQEQAKNRCTCSSGSSERRMPRQPRSREPGSTCTSRHASSLSTTASSAWSPRQAEAPPSR